MMGWELEYKEWDSKVLGIKCGKVRLPTFPEKHDYDFLHARVMLSSGDLVRGFRRRGFRIVGMHQELYRGLLSFPPDDSPTIVPSARALRCAHEEDANEIGELAYGLFVHDRLHADPRIPTLVADRYKAEWGRNACLGYADATYLLTDMWGPVGFVAVKGQWLYFIGVRKDWQRRGLGRVLVEAACAHVARSSAKMIWTSTQGGNIAALNMYTKAAFTPGVVSLDMHWIRDDNVFHNA